MSHATFELNRTLVLLSYEMITACQNYVNAKQNGPTKDFQIALVRFGKGVIKAWWTWVVMQNINREPGTLPDEPPWILEKIRQREAISHG